MLYIRADMNETIATGHVMRCLAVADALKALGGEAVFVLADGQAAELLQSRGYAYEVLETRWDDMEAELSVLLPLIRQRGVRQMLVDSYRVTPHYLEALQGETEVSYLDDLDRFPYPCDRIINYAVYAADCSYAKAKTEKKCILGTRYMPLRKAFWNLPKRRIYRQVKRILFMSGGADALHFTKAFLLAYISWSGAAGKELTVICGRFQQDCGELKVIADRGSGISVRANVADIENEMLEADIAISAGGTTLYELCACGTPAVSYLLADNQIKNAAAFEKEGLIPFCGDIRRENVTPRLFREIERMQEDYAGRCAVAARMQQLVDGKGAMRIAKELLGEEIR